jgi:hypothetical protein
MAQSAAVTLAGPQIIVSRAITHADNGATVTCAELPAGAFVPPYGVVFYVAEEFAGGTPAIDIGVAGATNDFCNSTDTTETTIGCYTGTTGNGSALAPTGVYYASATNVIATVSDTTLTNGTGYVFTTYYDFSDRDLAASA